MATKMLARPLTSRSRAAALLRSGGLTFWCIVDAIFAQRAIFEAQVSKFKAVWQAVVLRDQMLRHVLHIVHEVQGRHVPEGHA
mmetsp:Transcript_70951/g.219055  ORF Transcript_70951/g.219055 Transcript_70951/m.219055 type:complete len:83 (-) Transcript_70951:1008-1256(-)